MTTAVDRGATAEEAGVHPWAAAVGSGLLAGAAMGVVLSLGTRLLPLVGALYGLEWPLGGWLAHLANSVVFAFLFAAALSRPFVSRESFTLPTYAGVGLVYGAFLGVAAGGILFPLWLNVAVGSGLPFPFVPLPFVGEFGSALVFGLAHLVYGAVLGPTYALLSRSVPV